MNSSFKCGHEATPSNTYKYQSKDGYMRRACITCADIRAQKRLQQKPAPQHDVSITQQRIHEANMKLGSAKLLNKLNAYLIKHKTTFKNIEEEIRKSLLGAPGYENIGRWQPRNS